MGKVHLRVLAAAILLVPFVFTITQFVRAQRSAAETYAITNARIITVSGPVIDRGTVVIRDGLIAAVGANVSAPADARVIDGTGLAVYPGLIDANTSLGFPEPSPSPSPAVGGGGFLASLLRPPAAPTGPNSSQPVGMQPEIRAEALIKPDSDEINAARNAGFTTVLTAPRSGIWIGQSALVNLSGATPQEMIVRSPVAMHVGFTPLRGRTYPGSLMGVFAAMRQMLLDAQRYREAEQVYERSPRGVRRPTQDRSLDALLPVLEAKMPVVFYANSEREIERALDLADEFKLHALIAGGLESWKLTERLQKQNVAVLLSLNFPRRTTAAAAEADPEPLRVLRERVEAPKTAAKLASAKIRFSFQSGGMRNISDFLPNVEKAIESGISSEEALRALTIRPAEIFGVADRLGSIETGKIANLTVVRGDLFDRKSRITHVFIDGEPVDLRPVPAIAEGKSRAVVAGTWALNVSLGQGAIALTLNIEQEGERLRGAIQGPLGSGEIANASVTQSGELRFTVPVTLEGQTSEATFTGTVSGNEVQGTVNIVGRSPGSFTGTRATAGSQPSTSPPPPPAAALAGIWEITIVFGGQNIPGTLVLKQQSATLSGTLETDLATAQFSSDSVSTTGFKAAATAKVQGDEIDLTLEAKVAGDEISGTINSQFGPATFSGKRQRKSW